MPIVCRHVFVAGRVQGVAFRWATRERAAELGLSGWVRNLMDGRVEVWIEGEPAPVDELVTWLRRGPPPARVTRIEVREAVARGLSGFTVGRTSPA